MTAGTHTPRMRRMIVQTRADDTPMPPLDGAAVAHARACPLPAPSSAAVPRLPRPSCLLLLLLCAITLLFTGAPSILAAGDVTAGGAGEHAPAAAAAAAWPASASDSHSPPPTPLHTDSGGATLRQHNDQTQPYDSSTTAEAPRTHAAEGTPANLQATADDAATPAPVTPPISVAPQSTSGTEREDRTHSLSTNPTLDGQAATPTSSGASCPPDAAADVAVPADAAAPLSSIEVPSSSQGGLDGKPVPALLLDPHSLVPSLGAVDNLSEGGDSASALSTSVRADGRGYGRGNGSMLLTVPPLVDGNGTINASVVVELVEALHKLETPVVVVPILVPLQPAAPAAAPAPAPTTAPPPMTAPPPPAATPIVIPEPPIPDDIPRLDAYKQTVLDLVAEKKGKKIKKKEDDEAAAAAGVAAAAAAATATPVVHDPDVADSPQQQPATAAPVSSQATTPQSSSAPASAPAPPPVVPALHPAAIPRRPEPSPPRDHERDRFNYASFDAGAKLLASSQGMKKASSILVADDDRYLMVPCNAPHKTLVVQLSEDIILDTLEIANLEHYASSIRDFQILGSATHPTDSWLLLGSYTAEETNNKQVFTLPSAEWVRFIKLRWLSHYGDEYYCTLTYLRVYGTTMLDSFREEMRRSEDDVKEFTQEIYAIKPSTGGLGASAAAATGASEGSDAEHASAATGGAAPIPTDDFSTSTAPADPPVTDSSSPTPIPVDQRHSDPLVPSADPAVAAEGSAAASAPHPNLSIPTEGATGSAGAEAGHLDRAKFESELAKFKGKAGSPQADASQANNRTEATAATATPVDATRAGGSALTEPGVDGVTITPASSSTAPAASEPPSASDSHSAASASPESVAPAASDAGTSPSPAAASSTAAHVASGDVAAPAAAPAPSAPNLVAHRVPNPSATSASAAAPLKDEPLPPPPVLKSNSGNSGGSASSSTSSSSSSSSSSGSGGQQSIFKSLTNRIMDLEIHQSISNNYVEEVAARYVKDMSALRARCDAMGAEMAAHIARNEAQWAESLASMNRTAELIASDNHKALLAIRAQLAEAQEFVSLVENIVNMQLGVTALLALGYFLGKSLLALLGSLWGLMQRLLASCCRRRSSGGKRHQKTPSGGSRHAYSHSSPILPFSPQQMQQLQHEFMAAATAAHAEAEANQSPARLSRRASGSAPPIKEHRRASSNLPRAASFANIPTRRSSYSSASAGAASVVRFPTSASSSSLSSRATAATARKSDFANVSFDLRNEAAHSERNEAYWFEQAQRQRRIQQKQHQVEDVSDEHVEEHEEEEEEGTEAETDTMKHTESETGSESVEVDEEEDEDENLSSTGSFRTHRYATPRKTMRPQSMHRWVSKSAASSPTTPVAHVRSATLSSSFSSSRLSSPATLPSAVSLKAPPILRERERSKSVPPPPPLMRSLLGGLMRGGMKLLRGRQAESETHATRANEAEEERGHKREAGARKSGEWQQPTEADGVPSEPALPSSAPPPRAPSSLRHALPHSLLVNEGRSPLRSSASSLPTIVASPLVTPSCTPSPHLTSSHANMHGRSASNESATSTEEEGLFAQAMGLAGQSGEQQATTVEAGAPVPAISAL